MLREHKFGWWQGIEKSLKGKKLWLRWPELNQQPPAAQLAPYPWVLFSSRALVSLVSVSGRNCCYSCGRVERFAIGEIVEIANIDAVFMHIAENMVGCGFRGMVIKDSRTIVIAIPG